MKWEMEIDEIEAVLEKIWDLHDKLSDAIHSISRAHFLNSIKNPTRRPDAFSVNRKKKSPDDDPDNKIGSGFVFVKEFRIDDDEVAVLEAKSLYSIRTALENLEDQLEFFHTVQTQQKAERDAAIARLEQSRIILAMRLADHQGKKYKVIEEAQALVGDVRDASPFVAPEHLYGSTPYPSNEKFGPEKGKRPNAVVNFLLSSYAFVTKSLKLDQTVGIVGNAALLAISMLAFLHLNQIGHKMQDPPTFDRERRKFPQSRGSSSGDALTQLDVTLARG
ncbi:plastid division protein PDV1-like [Salvia splendens]|uniref:plastid division protein PDV1-like n=1 Tax=Salvia splendens TaxID=180675 RepID=UPI0011055889|nr:plastid division protein PDV1-like [Salvia splendens]